MSEPSVEAHYRAVQRLWDCERPVHAITTPEYFAEIGEKLLVQLRPGGQRLLDVGCGTGDIMMWLGTQGLDCYGFDFADAKLSEAERKNPGRVWKQSFLEPFKNGAFDYIVSWTVLQYCRPSELVAVLRHSIDALTIGGQCVHAAVPVMEMFDGANGVYYKANGEDELNLHWTRFEAAARYGMPVTEDGTFFNYCSVAREAVLALGHEFRSYVHGTSRYRMTFEIIRKH